MKKVRFSKEQPEVTVITIDGKDFYYICLNGTEGEDEETGEAYIEYDYNEIIVPEGVLDKEDIKTNPGNYTEYEYKEPTELTTEEQLNDIQIAITEIYEMIIGGE